MAFANSPVAAVHALAYPLGGTFHVPHGLSNALVLPHVLKFNCATASDCYSDLAPSVFPDLNTITLPQERADAFAERMADLCQSLGLATRLRDVGVKEHHLEKLAKDAMKQTRLLVNNPRELNEADALAIYTACL